MIKKWLPFIFLLVIILGSSSYLVLGNKKNNYKPNTDNPKVIYREACMHCHGDKGQGTGLLYPAFEDIMNKSDIEDAIIKAYKIIFQMTGGLCRQWKIIPGRLLTMP